MTALIIEDESVAVLNLRRQLDIVAPDLRIVAVLQSVEESVEWLSQNTHPEVIFMDIHLADGLAFRIFDQVTPKCPIIFTTAYDQYALQAFQVNSIDYLLKPINRDDLQRALDKLHRMGGSKSTDTESLSRAIEMLQQQSRTYKSHLLVPVRDKLVPVAVADIAFIYLDNKVAVGVTYSGRHYSVDKPLDVIMSYLDPKRFFRVNRQYIVAHRAIKELSVWLLGKYTLSLVVDTPERIVVPKARVNEFKNWYTTAGE